MKTPPPLRWFLATIGLLLIAHSSALGADEPTFFRGLNLNGPPVVIDDHPWQGKDSREYKAQAKAFENQQVPLKPATDAERAKMIRSSRWGDVDIVLTKVPSGVYSVFLYVWEDNNAETYKITLNGQEVLREHQSGLAGHWDRLGPWITDVRDGSIRLQTKGGAANVSGIEVWAGCVPDPNVPKTDPVVEQRRQDALAEAREFWSFQPIQNPPVPTVKQSDWPQNEIDHFILAELEKRNLPTVGDADRYTLLRRATFDLIGLPPPPEEIRAFVNDPDPTPKAFDKVIERLLASRHYGERWGRHWMDLVRYADTAGDNSDYPVPQVYLYRNYVIDSFNEDKPYDVFLREQIAGDLMPAKSDQERNRLTIATGYIALARRFGSLVKDYPQHLTIEDTIDNVGRTVLGLTISCARCHDHKFDPISQRDYYGLYGILDSTRYPFPGIELDKKPREFVPLKPTAGLKEKLAYAVIDATPHDARVHRKGDPKDIGAVVPRKFLDVLGDQRLTPAEARSSGRLQLAEWLTDRSNPLTARVMANRIWHGHFGSGIVATPSDFGIRGIAPSHPELLDWLATQFQNGNYSIKQMHRLIMRSRTYQLASTELEANHAVDPDNVAHWRFNRHRLDAESLRDAMLAISGNLDTSALTERHPFPPVDKWQFTQHHPFKEQYPSDRRSVYLMTARLNAMPYFTTFDGPDRNATTPRRDESVTATQALYMLNDEFVHEQAKGLAGRLLGEAAEERERVVLATELTLGRPPRPEEIEAAGEYLARVGETLSRAGVSAAEQERLAWESYARVLFRLNEFLYLD